jgi:hypothetical protein
MTLSEVMVRYQVAENPLKAERRVELLAVILLLILGLQIVLACVSMLGARSVALILPSEDVLTVGALEQVALVNAAARNEIVSRPLFWEGRSPVSTAEVDVVEPDQTEPAEKKIKGVKVVGIYGSGTAGGAIVRVKGAKRRVAIGEEINGWVLDTVSTNSVRFVKGASSDELMLQMADVSKIVIVVPSPPKKEPAKVQNAEPSTQGSLGLGGIDRG